MWLLLVLACSPWIDADYDGDGFAAPADCDDGDKRVRPGAQDPVGDEIDWNCDGVDGVDADGDGLASLASGGTDCRDDDPDVLEAGSWYLDGDGDGFGAGDATVACEPPDSAWVSETGDCKDADDNRFPGASEPCGLDLDCDGEISECIAFETELLFTGPNPDGGAGWAVAAVGDFDGDGYPDLAVGGPGAGTAWILDGPFVDGASIADAAVLTLGGSDGAGRSVAGVGDLDLDGFDDVVVGADGDDVGGIDAGAVWVVHGSALGNETFSSAALMLIGEEGSDFAGRAVAGAGNADDDDLGRPDILVGAPGHGSGGAVYLVNGGVQANLNLGAADLKLVGPEPRMGAGWSVAGGDLDGDGVSDMLVGGPLDAEGRAWLKAGERGMAQQTVSLDTSEGQMMGLAEGDLFGWAIAVGDVDGDGRSDAWISAPGADDARGVAWLVLGESAPLGILTRVDDVATAEVRGELPGDRVGESLVVIPDADASGQQALAVAGMGASTAFREDGAVWLVFGAAGTVDVGQPWIQGDQASAMLGAGLAAGDLNLDGLGDLVTGIPGGADGAGELGLLYGGY